MVQHDTMRINSLIDHTLEWVPVKFDLKKKYEIQSYYSTGNASATSRVLDDHSQPSPVCQSIKNCRIQ